jgi:hypothetical protein
MLMSKLDRRRIRARDTRAMTRRTVSFIFVPQILERMIAELAPHQRERVKCALRSWSRYTATEGKRRNYTAATTDPAPSALSRD